MADARLRERTPGHVPEGLARARHRAHRCPWCGGRGSSVLWSADIAGPLCCCTPCYLAHPEGPWRGVGRVEGGHPHGTVVCARCPLKTPQHHRSYPCPGPVPPVPEDNSARPWSPMHPPPPGAP